MVEDRGSRLGLAIRWIARVWSVATIVLVLLFLVGEPGRPSGTEWLGFLFFPVGICVGMVVAWRKEALGGAVTVGSLVMFYVVHLATSGRLPTGWAFLVFAAPGLLFVVSGAISRRKPTRA